MQNYNIVIISVSPLLSETFRSVMKKKNLSYPLYEATMEKAEEIVKRFQKSNKQYVFITRGRTYSYLSERTDAVLVDVKSTYFSYATLIKKYHERGIHKIAILGFSEQFNYIANKLNNVLDTNIVFYHYNWREYRGSTLKTLFRNELLRLNADGIEAFIGSALLCSVARELGLICAENFPDVDMIDAALREAQQIAKSILSIEEKNKTVSAFLEAVPEILLRIGPDGQVTEYNSVSKKFFGRDQITHHIQRIFPGINLELLSHKKEPERSILLNYHDKKVVADFSPIIIDGNYSGAIISARQVDEIQQLEQNIRSRLSQKGLVAKASFPDILGNSPIITQTVNRAKRIAQAKGTVLIIGETGTGKELFAQSIHNYSPRAKAPFVAINCAALSPNVLESELFGYVKGAFTGARSEGKQGIFELAHGGTIFLDEIGELPVDIQAKLLRVIQEKEVIRVGDTRVIPIDVRVTAATNRDLKKEVDQGNFRADLFYRLNVLTLRLPPLCERKDDIALLAQKFLSEEQSFREFTPDALEYMSTLPWPGNIRQLRNYVERACVFVENNHISQRDFESIYDYSLNIPNTDEAHEHTVCEIEKIISSLAKHKGSRIKAASELGISTVTLWRKIKKYEITDDMILNQFSCSS